MIADVPAPLAIVLDVIEILDELGIRYHLGGSFASAIHGVPRQTMDADIIVDLDAGRVAQLAAELKGSFYVDQNVAKEAVSRRGSFNAIHFGSGFKVDFFVKGTGEFDDVEFNRSELAQVVAEPPRSAYVKTAEDIVLRKLQWYADGDEVSERQWRDVLGVLLTAGDELDLEYLQTWGARLGVGALLNRALGEVERD